MNWPTPEAPSALPLEGATPAVRQSRPRGVRWFACATALPYAA